MQLRPLLRVAAFVAALTACSSPDESDPAGPTTFPETGQPAPRSTPDPARDRHERLAARMAKALRDPAFRATIHREILASPYGEKKVHLQAFLDRNGAAELKRLARLSGDSDAGLRAEVDGGGAVEVYFPVPAHRASWDGGTDLVVATAETDSDYPVAFDLFGRRRLLGRVNAPDTPVLMVSRAETNFSGRPSLLEGCLFGCGGGTTGGGSAPPKGLYMTQAKFSGTFESWFKGNPEFEVHILGQAGTSNALTTYQCAGEHVGAPYTFDQNETSWTGQVMLVSQTQLDQYKVQHPGQNLRVFVVEDDDTSCEIKVDSTRTANLFKAIKVVYGDLTGGKDSTTSGGSVFKKASILLSLVKAVANWFKTNDDPVGNAVEDPGAASAWFTGANWLVRGEQSAVNGAIRLEMR